LSGLVQGVHKEVIMTTRFIAGVLALLAGIWVGITPFVGTYLGLAAPATGWLSQSTIYYHYVPGGVVVVMALYLLSTDSMLVSFARNQVSRALAQGPNRQTV
jgi:hypothetical protein